MCTVMWKNFLLAPIDCSWSICWEKCHRWRVLSILWVCFTWVNFWATYAINAHISQISVDFWHNSRVYTRFRQWGIFWHHLQSKIFAQNIIFYWKNANFTIFIDFFIFSKENNFFNQEIWAKNVTNRFLVIENSKYKVKMTFLRIKIGCLNIF